MLKPNAPYQAEKDVADQLQESLDFLLSNDADAVGIACNNLHCFLKGMPTQLINMVKLTKERIDQNSKVLVLATSTSIENRIYEGFLPLQKEQNFIDQLIRKVLSRRFSFQESQLLKAYILCKKPNAVLLGCSELSVLFDAFPFELPGIHIIDPLDLLTEKLCWQAF